MDSLTTKFVKRWAYTRSINMITINFSLPVIIIFPDNITRGSLVLNY